MKIPDNFSNILNEKFSTTGIEILKERYLLRDDDGNVIETPEDMFMRVAKAVSKAEESYGSGRNETRKIESLFYDMMSNLEFLPNSPTLMNAGTDLGQLSACFVLPVNDSLDCIFKTLTDMAKIQQSGGGTGFNFSRLRMKGDIVKSTKGVASGPVSFMKIYDTTTDVIKQGGKRRGANIGILNVNHPDIEEFIKVKSTSSGDTLKNFNISIAVTDKFMNDVLEKTGYWLINPGDNKRVKKVNAERIFNEICSSAWLTSDPGLVFIDEINRKHPLSACVIEATNPCGEVPLLPYESCNLGSINMTKMLKKEDDRYVIDIEKFERTIRNSVRFLDDVIDVNKFPLPEIEEIVKGSRKIGLGVMGFAEMLIMMKISYKSGEAVKIADELSRFLMDISRDESAKIGAGKGSFPNFRLFKDKNSKRGFNAMRNATVLSIAPTGSISIIANTTSGIEPLFALVYEREILDGEKFPEINKLFLKEIFEKDVYTEGLFESVLRDGNLKKTTIPEDIKEIFASAFEVPAKQHIKIQAAFQKHVDNAVSKTINLPENASVSEIKKIYMLAWKSKCKGITIYRDKSREKQVLYSGETGGCCSMKNNLQKG